MQSLINDENWKNTYTKGYILSLIIGGGGQAPPSEVLGGPLAPLAPPVPTPLSTITGLEWWNHKFRNNVVKMSYFLIYEDSNSSDSGPPTYSCKSSHISAMDWYTNKNQKPNINLGKCSFAKS